MSLIRQAWRWLERRTPAQLACLALALVAIALAVRYSDPMQGLPALLGFNSPAGESTHNTTDTTNNNIDKRLVTDGNSTGISSDNSTVTINALDGGAVSGAFDLAKTNQAGVGKSLEQVIGLAKGAIDLTGASAANVGDAYKTSTELATGQKQLATAAIAMVGVVAAVVGFIALKKKRS